MAEQLTGIIYAVEEPPIYVLCYTYDGITYTDRYTDRATAHSMLNCALHLGWEAMLRPPLPRSGGPVPPSLVATPPTDAQSTGTAQPQAADD